MTIDGHRLAQRIIADAAAYVALHDGPRGTGTRSLNRERVWAAANDLARAFLANGGRNIARMGRDSVQRIESRHGAKVANDGGEAYLYVTRGDYSARVSHMEGAASGKVFIELYDAEGTTIRRATV